MLNRVLLCMLLGIPAVPARAAIHTAQPIVLMAPRISSTPAGGACKSMA